MVSLYALGGFSFVLEHVYTWCFSFVLVHVNTKFIVVFIMVRIVIWPFCSSQFHIGPLHPFPAHGYTLHHIVPACGYRVLVFHATLFANDHLHLQILAFVLLGFHENLLLDKVIRH